MNYLSGNTYTYVDTSVSIGQAYYYSLTSFDTGKPSWSGVQTINNIPPLETSIFANRTQVPFIATIQQKPIWMKFLLSQILLLLVKDSLNREKEIIFDLLICRIPVQ
jgi:hypothetical protein